MPFASIYHEYVKKVFIGTIHGWQNTSLQIPTQYSLKFQLLCKVLHRKCPL